MRRAPTPEQRHKWRKVEDATQDGERWTCLRCCLSFGPRITDSAQMRNELEAELCLGPARP